MAALCKIKEEEQNFIKISILNFKHSPILVRQFFDRKIPPYQLAQKINQNMNYIMALIRTQRINAAQEDILRRIPGTAFPPKPSTSASATPSTTSTSGTTSNDFDLTLMICLLRNFGSIIPPTNGWDQLPNGNEKTDGAYLARLKYYRNMFASTTKTSIPTQKFKDIWTLVEEALIHFNRGQAITEITDLFHRDFDYPNTTIQTELANLKQQYLLCESEKVKAVHELAYYKEGHLPRNIEGYKIPEEIRNMDGRSIELYLEILKDGTEKRRDIRIIIVGKKGSGKTSLTRRLLKESLEGIKSTNGIEIHVKRCCIRTKDGEWFVKKEKEIGDMYKSRILEQIVQSGNQLMRDKDNQQATDKLDSETKVLEISQEETPDVSRTNKTTFAEEREENDMEDSDTTILYERRGNEHFSDLEQVLEAPLHEDELANAYLWDFAGDDEFYNTHQIFLAKDVIYVVVTKLGDKSEDMPGAFKFWFNSVHCYVGSTPSEDRYLSPPIIVVGTHTDELQDHDAVCYMNDQIENISGNLNRHIRDNISLSNINDPEQKIDLLRQKILETAKQGNNWNIELPLKFVLMEEALQDHIELETPILSLDHVKTIAKSIKQPITNNDELDLFLRYQHEIGSLVYFADMPDFIVLDTQWLVNAFRCIISPEKFHQTQLDLSDLEWKEVRLTGRLSKEILDAIFSKQPKDIQGKKDFIVPLMEKFDLLVRPRTNDKVAEDFYVPCMVNKASDDIAQSHFPDIMEKTHCLCLSFEFLPPPVFVQLVAVCCKRQDFNSSKIIIKDKEYPAFFKDVALFDISKNKCEKLLIAKIDNVIQLQVWKFGKTEEISYEDIRTFITTEIERLLKERFRVPNVSYKEMMKCPKTRYNTLVGMREYFTDMTNEMYRCDEHREIHTFKDVWFGKQKPREISVGQMNFMRIGWITLDILTDALYDLLKTKTTPSGPRKNFDISELYRVHRKLDTYIPTKGWGGKKIADIIHTNIGDDIERIRLIRNEMQHAKYYAMANATCSDLFDIIKDILQRLDNHIKPTGETYSDRANKVKIATFTSHDYNLLKEKCSKESHNFFADKIEIHYHY